MTELQKPGPNSPVPGSPEAEARQWALILHLSVFAGYVIPLAGLIAPIVVWQTKKDQFPAVDRHGKNMVNFLISLTIYFAISVVLTFVLIGIPMLIACSVIGIAFPIIAAVKAHNGEVWNYPMTIKFLK